MGVGNNEIKKYKPCGNVIGVVGRRPGKRMLRVCEGERTKGKVEKL